ncbi:MAG TPA: aromatic ring-hydroxylating dioxygenase subunit alpha [Candidatus Binatia bacterium]|nr:aromatic ring-hydroxylating dioxygenase subunit alpha [Candidatus Binatia bacterium]
MSEAAGIFTKAELEAMRRPLDEATSPPAAYYLSPAFHALEVERIFMKEWLWAGHEAQLPQPGAYFTITLAGEPVLVTRDLGGELHAFSAICRHRGAVLATGEGTCRAFECPYHGWTYSPKGELLIAPDMHEVKGFDRSQWGLTPLRLEAWAGILFVNFDPEARPLLDALGDLPAYVRNYRLAEMTFVERRTYGFECNWKMLVENAMETYHVAATHRSAAGTEYLDMKRWTYKDGEPGLWYDMIFTGSQPASMNTPGSIGESRWVIETLTERERSEQHFVLVYPNFLLLLQPDGMTFYVMMPEGRDRTKLVCDWYFPSAYEDRPDFLEIARGPIEGLDGFTLEDIEITKRTTEGYRSRFYRPGRFSLDEPCPHRLVQWVLDRCLGGRARPKPQRRVTNLRA